MMRSFEARGDTAVTDEPFIGLFASDGNRPSTARRGDRVAIDRLRRGGGGFGGTGAGRQADLVSEAHDAAPVGRVRAGLDVAGAERVSDSRSSGVLASYAAKRTHVRWRTWVSFSSAALRAGGRALGGPPPVVDAADILANPAPTLERLCRALRIEYTPSMLGWPRGPRPTDGVWAPAWYHSVERSTGFETRGLESVVLPSSLQRWPMRRSRTTKLSRRIAFNRLLAVDFFAAGRLIWVTRGVINANERDQRARTEGRRKGRERKHTAGTYAAA